MIIHITPDEIKEEYREPWKMGLMREPSIDYATNALHVWFEGKDTIIFEFKKYGWINDNRYNSYMISAGAAGITILIEAK